MIRPQAVSCKDVTLSEYGKIVDIAIQNIPQIYDGGSIENCVILPNHIHILLSSTNGRMVSAPALSASIGGMKRWTGRQCGFSLWQKSDYDHIMRDSSGLLAKWAYIDNNPAKWAEDQYFEV